MTRSIFSHLQHLCLCCRQGGSGGSCVMPLSILFQSFTTPEQYAGGLRRITFFATFNIVSVIYHSFAVGGGF